MPRRDSGTTICGIYLKIENGVITEYSAIEGEDHLRTVIETDDGSHRIGEIAFGTNPALDRVLSHPLPLEKMGGTIHMALGAAYPETGGTNDSAIHWDLLADMNDGQILADGEVIYDKGKFII